MATQPTDLQPLLQLASDLARFSELFSALGLKAVDCWFIAQYPSLFGIQDIRNPSVADLPYFSLMLQHYARAGRPSATDDMLETGAQKGDPAASQSLQQTG